MAEKYIAYAGTYTRGESKGIYLFDVDAESGAMVIKDTVSVHNPSFLTISYDGRFLYSSCDEGVAAFLIGEDGGLSLLGKASVNGLRPGYISVDRENRFMLCGGYHDGKLTVLRVNDDGSAGEVTDEIFMKGPGSVGGIHYRSHVNCALFSPDERYVIAVDLGTDQVKVYEFDHEKGKLELHDILRSELESGPKHMLFSSDGRYAYLTHEYSNEVIKYSYDPEEGKFTQMQSLSTIPEEYEGSNSTITLRLTSDDRHLFVTNSGDNSIAMYNIDVEEQSMKTACILPVSGEYPRDVAVFPGNKIIASANQEGNTITTFKVDYEKGCFLMKNKPVSIPSPTCIRIRAL